MHLRILKIIIFLLIVWRINSSPIYGQSTEYNHLNDSVFMEYFENITSNKIDFEKHDSISNLLDLQFGGLFDSVLVKDKSKSNVKIDKDGDTSSVEYFDILLKYRRVVTYYQLNDSLTVGTAMNLKKDQLTLKIAEGISFQIFLFVFDIKNEVAYFFESTGIDNIENEKDLLWNTLLYSCVCNIYNNKYEKKISVRLRKNCYITSDHNNIVYWQINNDGSKTKYKTRKKVKKVLHKNININDFELYFNNIFKEID